MNLQEKEQMIVGTILSCNDEIKKFSSISKPTPKLVKLFERNNIYHFNMSMLIREINPLFESVSFDQKIEVPQNSIYTQNVRGNYYAYFQKVHNFLDGFELSVQRTLNESLKIDGGDDMIDILSFKDDLKQIIAELSKTNEIENLPKEILKIKVLANKPILLFGYDIVNNVALRQELTEKFGVTDENLIAICFDKTNKQLLFVCDDLSKTLCYSITEDNLGYYNLINTNNLLPAKKITIKNYILELKDHINNNIVELYINTQLLGLKFTNNVFNDTLRTQFNENKFEEVKQQSLVKK